MIERRTFVIDELRANRAGGMTISGHAAVFNKLSDDLGGFRERIRPGAFAESIKNDDIRALWNHDPSLVLGRNKSGTLELAEDGEGLAFRAKLPETTLGRDSLTLVERGDVDQMSFGFWTPPKGDDWQRENGGIVRELIKVQLFDVSPVTFPAYPQTDVSARSFYEARMKAIGEVANPAELEQAQARANARRELIKRLTPPPDKYSLSEILKRCRTPGE